MSDNLGEVSFFSTLLPERLGDLSKVIEWRSVKKGERLFEEGNDALCMYIISSGRIKVVKEFPNGKSAIMGIFGAGATVAEIAVMDGLPYPASAIALEESRVGSLPADKFIQFLKQNPEALIKMVVALGTRLREFVGNLGSLAVQSVEKRLARFLVNLSLQIGVDTDEGILLTLTLTRQDLAEIIGTSFEVVERSLKKMKERGLVSVDGKKIVILKPDELEALFTE